MSKITDKYEREVLKAFLASVNGIKTAQIKSLESAIANNDVDLVLDILGLERSAFTEFEQSIATTYLAGGTITAVEIGKIPLRDATLTFRFDMRDYEAEKWLREHSSNLITDIVSDQREAVKIVLSEGMELGNNPRTTALDIVGRINPVTRSRQGGIVGLTSQQAGWINNARRELQDLDPRYFNRVLRDKRFDSVIRNAIASGKDLTSAQIEKAINQMANRALRYRAETIARTEALTALSAGQFEAIKQAKRKGEVSDLDTIKVWDATNDSKTRPDHAQMEGQERLIDQPFNAPDGSLLQHPRDRSLGASAAQVIQCRCRSVYKVDFIGKALRINGFA